MIIKRLFSILFFFVLVVDIVHLFRTSEHDDKLNVDPILIEVSWNTHDYDLHIVPSVLVPANPLSSRQFSPIAKEIYDNLKELNVEFARFGAWYPFPHISVAELDPPSGLFQCGNVETNFSVNLSCELTREHP